MNATWPLIFALAGIVLGIAALARLAGWSRLAQAFPPSPATPTAQSGARWQSLSVGSVQWPIHYRRCAEVTLGEVGIGVRLQAPFNLFSPGFLAPWSAVQAISEQISLFSRKIHIDLCTGHRLTLSGDLGQLAATQARHVGLEVKAHR